jgi:hypothetical protein
MPSAGSPSATLASTRSRIYLTLTDGVWPGDSDASANGVIVDPGGPAIGSLTPMAMQSQVLSEMQGLRSTLTNKDDQHKLDDAINHLSNSLDPTLWAGEIRLDSKHGDKVFSEQKDAVNKLVELLKDKKSTIPDAQLQDWINRIVKTDELLAKSAIVDATVAGGKADQLKNANDEFAKALQLALDGKYADAIDHYGNAWQHAQEVVKK